MAKSRIVVVGSANIDLTVFAGRLPAPGETVLGDRLVEAGGGKGANQAVAAARAGAEVAFVGRVGDDGFGRTILDNLKREGVQTDRLVVDGQAASGVALIVVDNAGENLIAVAPGANARVTPDDIRAARDLIEGADLVLTQLEIPYETVTATVETARQAGVPVLLNPAPAPPAGELKGLMNDLDYLTPNLGEAARLAAGPSGQDAEALARILVEAGVGAVILTLGTKGVLVCDGGDCTRVSAPPVKAVDSVGAGDCFAGTLAVALSEGLALNEAALFATCAAALSVQRPGAQPSLPQRNEIENLFQTQRQA